MRLKPEKSALQFYGWQLKNDKSQTRQFMRTDKRTWKNK